MRNVRRAFTLIEMIAVLTLLLILAGLAVPSFQSVISESRQKTVNLAATAMAHEIDAYAASLATAPVELGGNYANISPDFSMDLEIWGPSNGAVTVGQGQGANKRCATITLAVTVGGTSTVAADDCPATP